MAAPDWLAMPTLAPTVERHRLAHRRNDRLGQRREVPAGGAGGEEDEFVAAVAGDEIAGAFQFRKDPRGMHEHLVAGEVPERVVDLLEAVEIDMQHCKPAAGLACLGGGFFDRGIEVAAVRQARQMVVQRRVFDAGSGRFQLRIVGLGEVPGELQFLLQLHVIRHVPVRADQVRNAGRVDIGRGAPTDMADLPVAADDAEFVGEVVIAENAVIDLGGRLAPVFRVQGALPGQAVRRFRKAVHLDHAVVPAHLAGAQVHVEDADARNVERQFQPAGHLCEPFLGFLALRDVGVGAGNAAGLAIGGIFDDRAAALDPHPAPVAMPLAIAEDVEGSFAVFLPGDLLENVDPVVGMDGLNPGFQGGLDGVVRLQAANGAPLAGVEKIAAGEIVVPDALAGGFQGVVPAALPLGKFERIALALVDVDGLYDQRGRRLVFRDGKGRWGDEGGEHPEFFAVRPLQPDFPGGLFRDMRTHGEGEHRAVVRRDAGLEGRQMREAGDAERLEQCGIGVDDAPGRIKGCVTESGACEKLAIKRLALRFSHSNGGRTGRFGHETRRLQ